MEITAIMLIKNEDVHIRRAILNIVDFCDKIIITDHQSTDQSFEICRELAGQYSMIELHRIQLLRESSEVIAPYYGSNTWIFAVDGDEIFDPIGLREMKARLLNGEFSNDWCIFANTLNCINLDLQNGKAWGYLAPPSRAGARLYNFSMIDSWSDVTGERLHGGNITFKNGYHNGLRRYLHQEMSWEHSYFRYVHASFLRRSSLDGNSFVKTRLNPDELSRMINERNPIRRIAALTEIRFAQLLKRDWKNQKYRRGPLVEKDVSSFFA